MMPLGISDPTDEPTGRGEPESLAEVLASIRALVSAETEARSGGGGTVLMLTPEMRIDAPPGAPAGEVLADGIAARGANGAPILDEESLRATINAIVREELQGELGDRIARNLRKLVRREVAQILEEQHGERRDA
jgi:hypothetical protein